MLIMACDLVMPVLQLGYLIGRMGPVHRSVMGRRLCLQHGELNVTAEWLEAENKSRTQSKRLQAMPDEFE